jgi:hypothetical protein
MDNNGAERAIRPGTLGRKNYYGSASRWCRLQVNRRLAHFEVRFLQLNRRPALLFAAKS